MQSDNRFFDDLARAAGGAMGALTALRTEFEGQIRAFMERWVKTQDWVTREEFEAVKEMAARARVENEDLARRLAELEARSAAPPPA
jgi:BMFP domain-containing protein YqiC